MTTGLRTFGSSTSGPLYSYKSWSGSDDPKRHKAYNAYTVTSVRHRRELTALYWAASGVYSRSIYIGNELNRSYPEWNANDELALLSKLSEKIRGHSFNAPVFAGELRESLDLIASSARAFRGLYKAVRRRDPAGALRLLASLPGQRKVTDSPATSRTFTTRLKQGDVGGAWLAIQYGWKPLLSDLYEAASAVEKLTSGPRYLTYRASHSTVHSWDDSSSSMSVVTASGMRKVTLEVRLSEPLSTARSLGLNNPLSVAWELIPFSFVVDWFIPIGTYLENLLFFTGLDIVYARKKVFYRKSSELTSSAWTTSAYERARTLGSFKSYRADFRRIPNVSVTVPRPELKAMAQAFSTSHIRNALALVSTIVGDRVKTGVTPFHVPLSRS